MVVVYSFVFPVQKDMFLLYFRVQIETEPGRMGRVLPMHCMISQPLTLSFALLTEALESRS